MAIYTTEEALEMICQEYDSGGRLTFRRTGGFHCSIQRMTVMWIWECQCSRHPCCLHCPHRPCCHHHPYHHYYVLVHDHKPQIPEQIQALGGENTEKEEAMEAV